MSEKNSVHDEEKQDRIPENHFGFADFASFIASDRELSLYKGFRTTTARNLLYLQAELQHLSLELESYDREDQATFTDSKDELEKLEIERSARTWGGILMQSAEGNPRAVRRLVMIRELRNLTKEYGQ